MRWLAGRVGQALVTAVLAVVLAFFLMRAAPGDPLSRLGDEHPITPQQMQVLRARYGLDQPISSQFRAFVAGAIRGDFGTSIQYGRPVSGLILQRLPASLLLGGTVLLITFVLGSWLGAAQALRSGSASEQAIGALSLAAYATPSFWLGLVLAWLVGIEWRLLPAAGMHDPLLAADAAWTTRALDILRHLVLPAVTLAAVNIGATMRHERSAMLQALREPYVQSARARGLAERRIRWRHAFRNALFPVVTLFGLWLPLVVAGSVFVEKVFAWPGLGALAADAVSARDYPLLMGVTVLVSLMVVGGALLADAAYALLDPRVRRA
ncbi:MAG TPA: ABC transporter permease [Gemmatimonadales bacterium]|jgi:peptide/nickel transport system permease protein|nr:ABC transporter permease [Gemmatimonadales bacterium]